MTSTDEQPLAGLRARVRTAIQASALSQRELARRIGMDPTALSKVLSGTRRLREDELGALAKACGVSVAYLERGAGPEPVLPPANGRGRARQVTAEERRSQILEAATILIARRGYHNVRVADIARYCGTSTATVHYHFPSKEATLHAALELYSSRLNRRLEAEFREASSARDKLRRLIEVQLPQTDDDVDEWSVWIQFWNQAMLEPDLRPVQRRIYTHWRGMVVDVLHECRAEGLAPDMEVDDLADSFTALVDGLAIQILAGSTGMRTDRMRALLSKAFEPHFTLD